MSIYERDGIFLIIIPETPKWFMVDSVGKDIFDKMSIGMSAEEIAKEFSEISEEDILETFEDLKTNVFEHPRILDSSVIERSLNSRTTVAMISVTRDCNLKCPHCYVDATGKREHELSLEEHQLIARGLYKHLAVNPETSYKINLTGGEPFFNKNIISIIDAYKTAGFDVNMSTNALLIKEEWLGFLKEKNVVLSVSLDGASSETHDSIRGRGTFNLVAKKIKQLTSNGIRVGINSLIHQDNIRELEKTITLTYDLGCSGFNPINLIQLGRACNSNLKRVSEVDIFRKISKHLSLNPKHVKLFLHSSMFSSMGAALYSGITCESCGIGNRPCVYIDEVGNVYPCPNTQNKLFLLGNITKDPIGKCVDFNHSILQELRKLNVDSMNEKCRECDVRYFCGGDCRGETFNVIGDIKAPYVACEDRHASIIELMWIVAQNPDIFESRAEEYISNANNQ